MHSRNGPNTPAAQPTADELLHFFNQSPDLLCIADFNGIFKRLNPAWSSLLGWTSAELQDARKIIEKAQPDAAIVDLNLPGPGGLELIKEMTARRIPLPVLVLSMHCEKLYAERALRAGAKGYISKEQWPAEVAAVIRTVVDGGIYASNGITKAILRRQTSGDQPPEAQAMEALSDRELEVVKAFHAANHCRQREEKDLAEVVPLGLAIAGIGELFKCFHAGRKTSGILFITSLLASHLARLNQTIVSYKCGLY